MCAFLFVQVKCKEVEVKSSEEEEVSCSLVLLALYLVDELVVQQCNFVAWRHDNRRLSFCCGPSCLSMAR